jgi:hypothetical protein
MAAHSATAAIVPSVRPDQSQAGWATWLREIATSLNLLGAWANTIAVSPSFTGDVTATGKYATSVSPAIAPALDASAATITVASGAYGALCGYSGLIVLTNNTNGDTGVYACGGGGSALISTSTGTWVAATSTPAAGRTSIFFDSGASRYTIANSFGSSVTFGVAFIGTRASA